LKIDEEWKFVLCAVVRDENRTGYHPAYRCSSRQIFGGANDFCPNYPKNIFGLLFVRIREYFFMTTIFGMTWAPFFSNQSTSGVILARIFKEFVQIFRDFAKGCQDFHQIKNFGSALASPSPTLLIQLWFN